MNKIKFATVSVFIFFVFVFVASADTLGQSQRFFISPQYDIQSRAGVIATLRYVSDRAYFYIADDYWNGIGEVARDQVLNQVNILAREFDQRIYPIETQFFGSEPNPGIDNDSRITILLAPLIENAGGYFDTANQYQPTEVSYSNQREMIFLNVSELANQNKMFAFLAHEFQHLISFNQKEKLRNISDDIWTNELRSEYAPTLLGYNDIYAGSHLQKRARALLSDPSDSLTEWKNLPADYGQVGMFGEYIAEHWSSQVIADTLRNDSAGFNSLAESLIKNGFGDTNLDIFRGWLIANYLNDDSDNAKFGYSRTDLTNFQVASTRTINNLDENTVFAISDSIKDWQGRWYNFIQLAPGQKNILKISFSSLSLASFHISYIVFGSDDVFKIYTFNPTPNSNIFYISDIGTDISRIVMMPIKRDKVAGFSDNEIPVTLTTLFERIESLPANAILPLPIPSPVMLSNAIVDDSQPITDYQLQNTNLPDGSLIRARGDYKVYVIKGKWRRHIISPEIFKFYPHLGFDKVKIVSPSVLASYQESDLIRYAVSQRVYEVDKTGKRRWLNLSVQKFTASGRQWDAIFAVNLKELQFYKVGSNIMR